MGEDLLERCWLLQSVNTPINCSAGLRYAGGLFIGKKISCQAWPFDSSWWLLGR